MIRATPPSIAEIGLPPLIATGIIEVLHSKGNELGLFFIPFLVVIVELFLAQKSVPSRNTVISEANYIYFCRRCIAWRQIAALALLFMGCSAVVVANPTSSPGGWLVVAGAYLAYFTLRWRSRQYWRLAVGTSKRSTRGQRRRDVHHGASINEQNES